MIFSLIASLLFKFKRYYQANINRMLIHTWFT